MNPETIKLYVPYSVGTTWIVRREVARLGTYSSRDEAVTAAMVIRSRLSRAHGYRHPPVQVQEHDGSWHDFGEP